ncbi:hypothetical protein I3271_09220 [Photobacterium leiognathi]|uniref:hypothetical protein n=1 Tax=Photobacterium leiognathi TaxID=553611 RepID=UPI001EDDCD8A|nr:hypothetical protein [Photobacterium leiognathi]MCG3884869.1 hypothetical protein [Photobacterium leiognathi]
MTTVTYKKLSQTFLRMSKQMKKDGECSLASAALLSRFAKAFGVSSSQALKKVMAVSCEASEGVTVSAGSSAVENHLALKELVAWLVDSYDYLIKKHSLKNTSNLYAYIDSVEENNFYFDFIHDNEGLSLAEFSLSEDLEDLYLLSASLGMNSCKSSERVPLSCRSYCGIDSMIAELLTERLQAIIVECWETISEQVFEVVSNGGLDRDSAKVVIMKVVLS